jgi:hypothetical protein
MCELLLKYFMKMSPTLHSFHAAQFSSTHRAPIAVFNIPISSGNRWRRLANALPKVAA